MATAPKTNGAAPPDETRDLACKLTDVEKKLRGEQMADAELEIEQWKLERASVGAKITKAATRRAELAHVIDKGEELRPVRCTWSADYAKNVWRMSRTDTKAEVDTRAMTASDRNVELGFDGDDDKPKPASKTKASRPPRKAPLQSKASKKSTAHA
jgi:hypothetical protein